MITFLIGLAILFIGYLFYSRYVENQFEPKNIETPANKMYDGVDYMPLSKSKNLLINLLNIAGMGPILGAIQGILFGPIAFILIPLGAVLMGGTHDYFAGMLSVRNDGAQITDLIKKYIGNKAFKLFMILIPYMLIIVAVVFIYTSGDIVAGGFFNQTDFSISNPVIILIYIIILLYFIIATLFPIDKIIGNLYPIFALFLIIGSLLLVVGFIRYGVNLQELNIYQLNLHPKKFHLLPMFFISVSCGLLSGFHSTQVTIISRTMNKEKEGKHIFYGMMCIESLIAMIWAAAAMHVYSLNIVPPNLIGTDIVINKITNTFIPSWLAIIVTLAVVILPITSGDTALRAVRISIANAIKLPQNKIINRLKIIIPVVLVIFGFLYWAKIHPGSFGRMWRYFNLCNQILTIPTFICATMYLYQKKKNYWITLLPSVFFVFITVSFFLNNKIGIKLPYWPSQICGIVAAVVVLYLVLNKCKKFQDE